nr:MAG TPA: cytochrome c-550 domain protein [Caudoviricetes sp.]
MFRLCSRCHLLRGTTSPPLLITSKLYHSKFNMSMLLFHFPIKRWGFYFISTSIKSKVI